MRLNDRTGTAESMSALAFLHRTRDANGSRAVPGARVAVTGASGVAVELVQVDSASSCLTEAGELVYRVFGDTVVAEVVNPFLDATCYRASRAPSPFAPGEELALAVEVPDGRSMHGTGRAPGSFSFVDVERAEGACRMEPDTHARLNWTRADDAWTYVADSRIEGLDGALASEDLPAPDSLYLLGLSIGRDDTRIDFPRDFGLFDFFDGSDAERRIIRRLADGLPAGVEATIAVAAVDRNWVNWARGGGFNPSGLVRIPSVFGQGTGLFGAAVQRTLRVTSAPADGSETPPLCGPPAP